MSNIEVEKSKYKFPEYAKRKLAAYGLDYLKVVNMACDSCEIWAGDKEIAYISILTFKGGVPGINNNTIYVWDKKYVPGIKKLLGDWSRYYGYWKNLKIEVPGEHKKI